MEKIIAKGNYHPQGCGCHIHFQLSELFIELTQAKKAKDSNKEKRLKALIQDLQDGLD